MTLVNIARPRLEQRCVGGTRDELISAWNLLKLQKEEENFATEIQTLINDTAVQALKASVQRLSHALITDGAGLDEEARPAAAHPSAEVHHYGQLSYLLGLTTIEEPLPYLPNSDMLFRFLVQQAASDEWIIGPVLSMLKERSQRLVFTTEIQAYLREEMEKDASYQKRVKEITALDEKTRQTRFGAINALLQDDLLTEEMIEKIDYPEEATVAKEIEQVLLASGKRRVPQDNGEGKRHHALEGSLPPQDVIESDPNDLQTKISDIQKQYQKSLLELANEHEIEYSIRDSSLEKAYADTELNQRFSALTEEDDIFTEKAVRYFLKKKKILREKLPSPPEGVLLSLVSDPNMVD